MTECSIVLDDTDGQSTIYKGTEKSPFREGWHIAVTMARPVECVFNTMPQALFHRARLDDN